MGLIATQPITDQPQRAADFADDQTWIFELSTTHISEIRQARHREGSWAGISRFWQRGFCPADPWAGSGGNYGRS